MAADEVSHMICHMTVDDKQNKSNSTISSLTALQGGLFDTVGPIHRVTSLWPYHTEFVSVSIILVRNVGHRCQ